MRLELGDCFFSCVVSSSEAELDEEDEEEDDDEEEDEEEDEDDEDGSPSLASISTLAATLAISGRAACSARKKKRKSVWVCARVTRHVCDTSVRVKLSRLV